MKKLFIVIVLTGTVALVGVGGYFAWTNMTQTAQTFFNSGKKYYEQKKYPAATIQFLNAVQKDPHHRDSRFLLARSYIAQQNISAAAGQLKTLLEYYPDDIDANLELGSIYALVGRNQPDLYRLAQEIAQKVLAKEPANIGALVLSGNASMGAKDYTAAIESYQKAISLDPKNMQALVALGTAQVFQKNFPEAEKAFLKARETNPKDKSALLSLANYYFDVARDPVKAEAVFKDVLSQYPADRQIYLPVVEFYSRTGRADDVKKVLEEAQAKDPGNPEPSLALIGFYEASNRPDDARKLLLEVKSKFPNNVDVSIKVATDLMVDKPDQARKEIDLIIKTAPKNPVGYALLGEQQFRSGQFDAAEDTLSKDPALDSPFPQVHFILGELAARKGQVDQAIDHFQKSIKVNGNYIPNRLALAEAFINKGKLDDSREQVRKVLELQPQNPAARLIQTTLDMADKNYPAVEKELFALAKEQPDNPAVQRQLGIYYMARGKTADAEKSLTRVLQLAPNSEQSFRELVLFYVQTKQLDRANQLLNTVPDAQKKAFQYELAGIVAEQAGKGQDSENDYKKALEKEPNRAKSEQLLFNYYVKNKHMDDAVKMMDDSIKKNPKSGGAYAMKGTLLGEEGKVAEAKQNYEQALQADPNQDIAANNLAYILADEGQDLDKALQLAQGVRKRNPDNPEVADTLGWVYYKLNRPVLARESSLSAVAKQPENPVFEYHLGLIYKANSQNPEAVAALKKAIANPQDFKEKSLADAALKDIDHWQHLVPDTARKPKN